MTRFVYPINVTPNEGGGNLVEFPDFPFAVTDGSTISEAFIQAADCLEEALAICIDDGLDIPEPSSPGEGCATTVAPGPAIAAKAALYMALRETGVTKVALAARLGINEKEVRRMLDPHYATKIPALERALAAFGKRIEITVADYAHDAVDTAWLFGETRKPGTAIKRNYAARTEAEAKKTA